MRLLIGALFAVGLVLAGADGQWFPWINLAGTACIVAAVPLSWAVLEFEE